MNFILTNSVYVLLYNSYKSVVQTVENRRAEQCNKLTPPLCDDSIDYFLAILFYTTLIREQYTWSKTKK